MKRKDAEFKCVYAGPEMMSKRFFDRDHAAESEADTEEKRYCNSCGAVVSAEALYCSQCGFPMRPPQEPPTYAVYAGPPVSVQGFSAPAGAYVPQPPAYPKNYQASPNEARGVYAGPPVDVYAGPPIDPEPDEDE